MSATFQEFLRSRRSVREFLTKPVGADVLARALRTATYAASAHNRQPWRFALLESTSAKSATAEAMAGAYERDLLIDGLPASEVQARVSKSVSRITSAPAAVLLCCDASGMDQYATKERATAEHDMAVQSAANAGMLLLLALHAEGLGAVWTCAPLFAPDALNDALHLPDLWEPQALILIGFPARTPVARERIPLAEVSISL